ncbi:MAG TPA: signal peptidase I, partial [Caulobacteraceae bacterium]|nr:signal peptidase I [Caulobacteraceae bacterium]
MTADSKRQPDAKGGAVHEMVEIVKTVFYALLIAFVLRVVLFQPFTIPSASEEPNLYQGDYIIASKYSYGWSKHSIPLSPPLFSGRILFHKPTRGDIIIFKLPRDGKTDYIKRLIGLPGDRVQVRGGVVYVNDQPFPRERLADGVGELNGDMTQPVQRYLETNAEGRKYVIQQAPEGSVADNTGIYVVPPHCYFFMGDNRDNSADSRFDPGLTFDTPPPTCPWDSSLGVG